MATYTTIPDTSLDPAAPIRSVDTKALRDNPIAITEGASGAPRVRTAALQAPTAGTTYLINAIQNASVGTLSNAHLAVGLHRFADSAQHLGALVLVSGTITAYVEHRKATAAEGGISDEVRVLKNGSVVNTWTTTSTTFQARQENIAVAVGDIIVFQHRLTVGGATVDGEWQNIRIYSDQPDMAVA